MLIILCCRVASTFVNDVWSQAPMMATTILICLVSVTTLKAGTRVSVVV